MLSRLQPPKRLLSAIEERLRDRFEVVHVTQTANGETTASIVGIDLGALTASILWLEGDPDGHTVLREIAYHLGCVVPVGLIDLPIVVVERFSDVLRRHLAYEGRLLMKHHPEWDWLVTSLDDEIAGWFRSREITTLPIPQPQRS